MGRDALTGKWQQVPAAVSQPRPLRTELFARLRAFRATVDLPISEESHSRDRTKCGRLNSVRKAGSFEQRCRRVVLAVGLIGAPSAVATSGSTVYQSVRELGSHFAMRDLAAPLRQFCAAYTASPQLGGDGDAGTMRQPVVDLFVPLSDVNAQRARRTQAQVDGAFQVACTRHARDPRAFVASLQQSMQISRATLLGQIKTACTDVADRIRLESRYPGMYGHPGVETLEIATTAALDERAVRTGITRICNAVGRPITLPPPHHGR